jgi:nucleotide sugar dehydrogenase
LEKESKKREQLGQSSMAVHRSLRTLTKRVASKRVTVGIFGAGNVGLPLACAFADAGFNTIAGDNDRRKIQAIRSGTPYLRDKYVLRVLSRLVASKTLRAESDIAQLASLVDFAIITVPTPLGETGEPDLSCVIQVTGTIGHELRPGKFVIVESSVYPGTTNEVLTPILERTGLKVGKDFGLAYSPERIDYGNEKYSVLDIPKVVGGVTPLCTQIAGKLYSKVLRARVVPVSSVRVAESTKLLENTYRYVNIALANELALLHERLGIDYFEVVAAASTKPFGFQPFYPGPGVGGHCIPKDAQYLAYKAHQIGGSVRLVELSALINNGMIEQIMNRLKTSLTSRGKTLRGSKAVILGLAFKGNVSDSRNSSSITFAEQLANLGAEVSVYDPLVKSVKTEKGELVSAKNLEKSVKGAEVLVLVTPHEQFRDISLEKLATRMRSGATIVDTRGYWCPEECESAGFTYLGLGRP